ncbi:hypothetical protein [Flammeovirga sp. EKP202]|uniref:hypothetical protein n=1 Tax=Flammeovirga sp. EKP202 TaxID=2770592 RepID=UPI00165F31AB|nr:hypothetical protein [Flammeovirga sp. EKP202]MBD0400350.1 hypothetical protein [Flammeovirga sp. EKP202]
MKKPFGGIWMFELLKVIRIVAFEEYPYIKKIVYDYYDELLENEEVGAVLLSNKISSIKHELDSSPLY